MKKQDNIKKTLNRLAKIPRVHAANLPTPLERCLNIDKAFEGCSIFIKRDDLTGTCFGGNKERNLEFIIADALKGKARTLVTVGAVNSNHCRMVSAFAARYGFKAELILLKKGSGARFENEGNVFLDRLMGAGIRTVDPKDAEKEIDKAMSKLKAKSAKPYFIESGAHNALGVLGYMCCAFELKDQLNRMKIKPDYLVLPTGTGTTQAGLVMGMELLGLEVDIIGVSVARSSERCVKEISLLIEKTEKLLGLKAGTCASRIHVSDKFIGTGYAEPTKGSLGAIRLAAEREAVTLDPVYNAKAFSGMLNMISDGTMRGRIIYLNTGGVPEIFTQKMYHLPYGG